MVVICGANGGAGGGIGGCVFLLETSAGLGNGLGRGEDVVRLVAAVQWRW